MRARISREEPGVNSPYIRLPEQRATMYGIGAESIPIHPSGCSEL